MSKKLIRQTLDASAATLGLRERKKQQTRDAIAQAALRLFAERGYEETTLADIAQAANVAPRTIFAYYDGKEDIVLGRHAGFLERLETLLDERPQGTTTADALRGFLASIDPPDEDDRVCKAVISASPALQAKMVVVRAQVEPLLARSIAKDLGTEPDDIRAVLAAASVTAAFNSVSDRMQGDPDASHEQGLAVLDDVLDFLRGGLEALRRST